MPRQKQELPPRSEILKEFYASADESLYSQDWIAAVLDCSPQKLERDRWAGKGIKYRKIDGLVRYTKGDTLEHQNQFKLRQSTSEHAA